MTTYASTIADSVCPNGVRLTTMEIRTHRFVLSEFNTHRRFSRNSASSRAIPVARQLERVRETPAFPASWPEEQKGMQGGVEFEDSDIAFLRKEWAFAAMHAATAAEGLARYGLHKSVTNRLLEPFMWHTIVVTSTAWENFFAQRCSPLAQPEIRVVAEMMQQAYSESVPQNLEIGDWHLPYLSETEGSSLQEAVRISAARCARVSYLTQDGVRDIKADLALYDRLVTAQPAHWSPLEHVATPWPENRQDGPLTFLSNLDEWETAPLVDLPKIGNLLGWRSLRTEEEARQGANTNI